MLYGILTNIYLEESLIDENFNTETISPINNIRGIPHNLSRELMENYYKKSENEDFLSHLYLSEVLSYNDWNKYIDIYLDISKPENVRLVLFFKEEEQC